MVAARHDDPLSCPAKLHNCTQMVKPYLRDLRAMFPMNTAEVEAMCR